MSEIFSSLQTLMVDHIRLYLMNQIQNNRNANNITQLILLALVVGITSWVYESLTVEGKKSILDISVDLRSYIFRKHSIVFEGKHITGIDNFSRRPLTISNTFSKNFRSILFYVLKRVDTLKDVRELKEFASNIIKGEHYEESSGEDIKTIFTVSQRNPFLLDTENGIYCIVKEAGEHRDDNGSSGIKAENRIVKFNIILFSYKSTVPIIKEFVKTMKTEYSKYLEEKRRGKLFVYTLNNTEIHNEDDDTVGGWQETPHETMKSFDNIFFEGKREVMAKIDFFIKNKDWYKHNGIPYTLGIALYGPPGTGKTSFIKALSTYLNRHIIAITLSRIKAKKQLHDFYFETQYNNANDKNAIGFDKKIVVFEDIDCVGDIILKRNKTNTESKSEFSDIDSGEDQPDIDDYVNTSTTPEDKIRQEITKATKYVMKKINSNGASNNPMFSNQSQDNISLDDLLNLWDGIRENTGRIMIITTNHYDKLDPALIRPGRIDIALNLGNTSRDTIAEMYSHYYKEDIDTQDLQLIPDRFYSPAEIINIYVSNSDNPRGFIERLVLMKKINAE